VSLPEEVKIPTKPRKTPVPETNGHASRQQSEAVTETVPAKRAHPESPEDVAGVKKARTAAPAAGTGGDDNIVVIEDNAGGAIVIDDD